MRHFHMSPRHDLRTKLGRLLSLPKTGGRSSAFYTNSPWTAIAIFCPCQIRYHFGQVKQDILDRYNLSLSPGTL
jgi:hypothetical protein